MCSAIFSRRPIFGWLGDRLSRRWLIAGGVFVWSLGTLLSGHANSGYVSLLFFRVLVGFGEASFGTISPGWIADLFPPLRRNNAITIFYFAIPVGSALGYLAGGYLAVALRLAVGVSLGGLSRALAGFHALPVSGAGARGHGKSRCDAGGRTRAGRLERLSDSVKDSRLCLGGGGIYRPDLCDGRILALGADFSLPGASHGLGQRPGFFFSASLAATGLVATLAGGFWATRWQRRTGHGLCVDPCA